jgi:tagatose 1,6-diphosphate aldolase
MVTQLSIGKIRGLQQCSTARGAISVLALDHRNNLRAAMRPDAPNAVTAQELTTFKQQVIGALAPASTAVLLDPQFGAAQCIAAGSLPGAVGLLVAVEASGYTGDPAARHSAIAPGWSVAKTRRMGASAIKLLVYYHPSAPTAPEIEALVAQVGEHCRQEDIVFFLEPLSYSLDLTAKKLAPAERHDVVLESARRLTPLGVDVLKAEFPLDVKAEPDEVAWAAACTELSAASTIPWVLLSASVDYDTFLRQVTIACRQGASGVAVGRAVWQEAPTLSKAERKEFLTGVAYTRMQRITELCDALARPWNDFFTAGTPDPDWHKEY